MVGDTLCLYLAVSCGDDAIWYNKSWKTEWPNQETHTLHTREYRLSGSTIFKSFTGEIPTKPTGLRHLLWPWRHWEHHWVQCLHCQTTRTCQLLGFFYKWIGVRGEYFDWIKRDVATLLVKGNDVYTTLEALGVLYYVYFYEFSILFIFVGVMLF